MSFVNPSRDSLVIAVAPTQEIGESGLYIPQDKVKTPHFGRVVMSGRDCQCMYGDHVMFLLGSLNLIDNGRHAVIPERFCYKMFRGNPSKASHMLMHDGWVLIKIPYVTAEVSKNGMNIGKLNSTEGNARVTVRQGIVVKAPRSAYNEKDMIVSSYFDKSTWVDIKKGDQVFFSEYVINTIREGSYIFDSFFYDVDGNMYVTIPYKELICKNTSSGLVPLNGYMVCTKEENEIKKLLWAPNDRARRHGIDIYRSACSTPDGFVKGERLVINPAIPPIILEPDAIRTLDTEYYYFKKEYALLSIEEESVSFSKSKTIR
jgi:co-chaperonin GroES (HSP10)